MSIYLTERAAEALKKMLQEQQIDPDTMRLRVGIKGKTIDRQYVLDLDEVELPDDKVFQSRGLTVVCQEKDFGVLDETTIDYKDDAGATGFLVKVPEKEHITRGPDGAAASPPPEYEQVRQALYRVNDPEVGVNIIDLGLVLELKVEDRAVHIRMTLTTPACPLEEHIRGEIDQRVREMCPGVDSIGVTIVWQPKWTPDMMTPEGKNQLGWSR